MLPGAWASRPQGKGNHEGCPYYDNPNPVHIHHPVGAVREPPHAFGEVFTPSVRYPSPENFQQFYCQYLRCIVCLKQLSCPLRGTHNDENRCRVLSLRPPYRRACLSACDAQAGALLFRPFSWAIKKKASPKAWGVEGLGMTETQSLFSK